MVSAVTARTRIGEGVTLKADDETFGFFPQTLEQAVANQHQVEYRETVSHGVTTGTLDLTGLGAVKALEIEAEPSGGKVGITSVRFLDGSGKELVVLQDIDLPKQFETARAALSDFVRDFREHLKDIYAHPNEIRGTNYADVIRGGQGADTIRGNAGKDDIGGGAGSDRITGGRGADLLEGGSGADRFIFRSASESRAGRGAARIADFVAGRDKIDLQNVDADRTHAGTQSFEFVGDKAFSHQAGELRFADDRLTGDVNGDGKADFMVKFDEGAKLGGFGLHDILL